MFKREKLLRVKKRYLRSSHAGWQLTATMWKPVCMTKLISINKIFIYVQAYAAVTNQRRQQTYCVLYNVNWCIQWWLNMAKCCQYINSPDVVAVIIGLRCRIKFLPLIIYFFLLLFKTFLFDKIFFFSLQNFWSFITFFLNLSVVIVANAAIYFIFVVVVVFVLLVNWWQYYSWPVIT